jgi:hypothetical protein
MSSYITEYGGGGPRDLADLFELGDAGANTGFVESSGVDLGRLYAPLSSGSPIGFNTGFVSQWLAARGTQGVFVSTLTVGTASIPPIPAFEYGFSEAGNPSGAVAIGALPGQEAFTWRGRTCRLRAVGQGQITSTGPLWATFSIGWSDTLPDLPLSPVTISVDSVPFTFQSADLTLEAGWTAGERIMKGFVTADPWNLKGKVGLNLPFRLEL